MTLPLFGCHLWPDDRAYTVHRIQPVAGNYMFRLTPLAHYYVKGKLIPIALKWLNSNPLNTHLKLIPRHVCMCILYATHLFDVKGNSLAKFSIYHDLSCTRCNFHTFSSAALCAPHGCTYIIITFCDLCSCSSNVADFLSS